MLRQYRSRRHWTLVTRFPCLMAIACGIIIASTSSLDGFDDHGRKRGHYKHHGGGRNYLGISPYGITYGFYGRHFGIEIGPILGPGGWHRIGPADYDPYLEEAYDTRYSPGHLYSVPNQQVPRYDADRSGQQSAPRYGTPLDLPREDLAGKSNTSENRTTPDVPVANRSVENVVSTTPGAAHFQQQAEAAFRQQKYGDALRLANHAAIEDVQNGQLSLFRSQAAFAIGRYDIAYFQLSEALARLDKSQWGYIVERYARLYVGDDYVQQMDDLIRYASEHPENSRLETLRAYHYAYLGHTQAARKHLIKALAINGNDQVASRILSTLSEPLPAPPPNPSDKTALDSTRLSGPR